MPTAAGIQLILPIGSDSSNEGIISDQTDAATITPAAKPRSALCIRDDTLWRASNTVEAPITVPRKGSATIVRVFILSI